MVYVINYLDKYTKTLIIMSDREATHGVTPEYLNILVSFITTVAYVIVKYACTNLEIPGISSMPFGYPYNPMIYGAVYLWY